MVRSRPCNMDMDLDLINSEGKDIIGHSGGLHGFLTQLSYYPKEKLSVVMFSNTDRTGSKF